MVYALRSLIMARLDALGVNIDAIADMSDKELQALLNALLELAKNSYHVASGGERA